MSDYGKWQIDRVKVAEYLEALAADLRAGRGPQEIRINTIENRDPVRSGGAMVATMRRPGFIAYDAVLTEATERAAAIGSGNARLRREVESLRAAVRERLMTEAGTAKRG